MNILGIELTKPTRKRNIEACLWLVAYVLINWVITGLTGESMKEVPGTALVWLPHAVLWTFGWDPLRQGPPAWLIGAVLYIPSTHLAAIAIHAFGS